MAKAENSLDAPSLLEEQPTEADGDTEGTEEHRKHAFGLRVHPPAFAGGTKKISSADFFTNALLLDRLS